MTEEMKIMNGTIVHPKKISDGKLEYTVHGIIGEHFICFDKDDNVQYLHWHNLMRFKLVNKE